MGKENHLGRIFVSLNSEMVWELGGIVASAMLSILIIQHFVPLFANRLPGRKRLLVLAVIPFLRLFILITAFCFAVPLLIEPSLQNMVALLGTVGLALGFALKDYAGSLIAGIVSIGEQNYRNGDWITVGGVYGEVRHIGLRTVEIVTPSDDRVLIPHGLLWTQPVSNANNGDARLQCVADFYLHPDHDTMLAQRILEDVVLTSPYLYHENPVAVIVQEKPWGTWYRLKAYPVDSSQQFRFLSDLTVRGKEALRHQGLSFATATVSEVVKR